MAQKSKSVYICSECGYETPRWLGQCPNCNEWNTLNEEIKTVVKETAKKTTKKTKIHPKRRLYVVVPANAIGANSNGITAQASEHTQNERLRPDNSTSVKAAIIPASE